MQHSESNATRASLLLRLHDLNDTEAWEQFVDTYGPYVVRWCQGMGLQEADSADIAQNVLVKMMQCLSSFDYNPEKGSFRHWLRRVTRNIAIDLQRTWKERGSGDSLILQALTQIQDDSFEHSLFKSIESAYERDLLNQASQAVRSRVLSKTWDSYFRTTWGGESASVVGTSLDISIGEVYVAKSRVIKLLKEEIARMELDQDQACRQRKTK